ncbi:uncharacterized protein EI90DRAFT_3056712 [Cantharellus anzutake]|uniref:uncharacterized protein n=1 Tax=Cantharellus anzutake TaxID=1750568 RepID=UPI0019051E4D|nr:uncharacterized protein EI90DRAFT_3085210 [Cantharellus anzutake]XP_038916240.1 uncharacterized protein EI90DRAFT_3056712 [Cantharellus anzutake]KAF8317513.1 hypothetical protein EI90DRAFT_3085210 [Cantharellus anzutake]KAF8331630.1 hypothetical protein EI90DRAFT_3056712 [Cantharellus anzutake]
MVCAAHLQEVCADCDYDGREDNDAFFGLDTIDRDPLNIPNASTNKEGVYQCKKHSNPKCPQCFGWKKQIQKLQKEAKKAGKKNQGSASNFY